VSPRAILTDIEGTTSSIAFVHEVLFPFSRARLADYVAAQGDEPEVASILDAVRAEADDPGLDVASCTALLIEWHDADRKIGPLKALQGLIWAEGYASGALQGHVYPDAVEGLRRWHGGGIALYVYSSGSVAAQKLIFGHTAFGDLAGLFSGHFDTAVGGKKEAASYAAIAAAIGVAPAEILFLSDVEAELAAAAEAGLQVTLLARDGLPAASPYPVVTSFDAILPGDTAAAEAA
jgi:enolase-phosphatase E1